MGKTIDKSIAIYSYSMIIKKSMAYFCALKLECIHPLSCDIYLKSSFINLASLSLAGSRLGSWNEMVTNFVAIPFHGTSCQFPVYIRKKLVSHPACLRPADRHFWQV
jgi:hypothetical protein